MNKLPTWYVLEPRDAPCIDVNPMLWKEFERKCELSSGTNKNWYTEAYCVQWLDQFYEQHHNTVDSNG